MFGGTTRVFLRLVLTGCAVATYFVTARAVWAQPVSLEAAKKEGKVVIYGTVVPQVMTLIEKGFEGKYGVKIEYWRADATKVIDRVLTEWRAGKPGFDIVIGARGALLLGKEENVYAKFVPTNTANFPAKFKDSEGKLTAWRVTPVGVLYNTELVKSADVPKSLDDLLEAKWHGKISMPDPSRHASTAQYLWNQNQVKGEKWMDFVKGLAKQKPLLLESYSTVPTTIIRGESLLGITYVQYAGQTKGPINFAPIDKVFADPSDAALSAKAANPNAAKIFIEYLCSSEGQKRVAETGEFVLHPGIYPSLKGADKVMANMVFMENPSKEQLAKLQSEFRQIFLAK
jgi:iron(III) transport system substrate-binding protein